MDNNIERWLSMKEITEYLGVSRDTVLMWVEKYQCPPPVWADFGNSRSAMWMLG